ncbi:MAG: hypothetical protein KGI35_19310, partial [Burkholderiales bacterium]|nr:hypothetical protein [Burkholderiales bacterium]
MALRAKWTFRFDDWPARLANEAGTPQALNVSLVINALAAEQPQQADERVDCAAVRDWIARGWPDADAPRLLEVRVNDLLAFVFGFDKRVQDVWVGLYTAPAAGRMGIERHCTRRQYEDELRRARAAKP